ncbi:CMRF35-like molecule 1 isoform X2 [Echeneis naucrates]|uniref:CMRF35-like molecule 1 isoform X2 n=1 Tax=Echeneis naucrates TaxID=173247 RepID=UPI0011146849|nr:CMRF35-like molecule 1 isoform X2 [Echeneis naucrates]
MRHHRNLLVLLFTVLGRQTDAVIRLSGYEGSQVDVSCSYGEGYESYEKYLCRNNCGSDDDVLIKTTEANKDRFSISDDRNKRVYTTTISSLTSQDAGTYWCGVTRSGKDYYPAEIRLTLVPDSCCAEITNMQSYDEGSVSFSCPYESQYKNDLKYMCRGRQPSTCLEQAVITSTRTQEGRFTLSDEKESGRFTVNITSLTPKDSGPYLCGINTKPSLDNFVAFTLEVREWCCVTSKRLRGIVGRPLTMQCPYPPEHRTNKKFLCKGEHRSTCEVKVTSSGQTDPRLTLQDGGVSSFFSVTITELKVEDEGTYWCGSDYEWSEGNYTKIVLSADPSLLSPVISIVCAVVLLILICVLVILCKCKSSKVQGDGANVNLNMIKEDGIGDIYANEEVVVSVKKGTSKDQPMYHIYDNTGGDQQDCVYQNTASSEDLYCNQWYANTQ